MYTCECLSAWFHVTVSATVNCMQLSPSEPFIQILLLAFLDSITKDSENLRSHSSLYTLSVVMSLAFHYIANIL